MQGYHDHYEESVAGKWIAARFEQNMQNMRAFESTYFILKIKNTL